MYYKGKPLYKKELLIHQVISTLFDPMDCRPQAPLSMGFPRQEYWNGLPFLSPEDLPHPEIEPRSPALAGGFSTAEPPGKSPQKRTEKIK